MAPDLEHHDGRHALAEVRMRDADDRALDDAVELVDLALDFLRVDVVAAGDHEVLAAADDVDVAGLIDLAEVAADEIAVLGELGRRLFRHPPVAFENVRALDLDHAGFARGRASRRSPDR